MTGMVIYEGFSKAITATTSVAAELWALSLIASNLDLFLKTDKDSQ
jgi:hypothetical protein